MNLHSTVSRFSTGTFTDPYDEGAEIVGAIRPFAEVTNSGPSSRRRVLETPPDQEMFANRVIYTGEEYMIVGAENVDHWKGNVIRLKYPVLPCDFTSKLASVLQVITSTLPTRNTYAYPHYARGPIFDSESSQVFSAFTLYFSSAETVTKGMVAVQGSNYYRIRSDSHLDGASFRVAEAIQVSSPVQSLSYIRKTGYNPTTDTITNGSTTTVVAFVEDAYVAYDHTSERYAELKPGDKNITFLPTGGVPQAGETVGSYRILTIDTLTGPVYSCHCRRA